MENGKREAETPSRRGTKKRRHGIIRGIFSVFGTLLLIGICTTAMLVGIFMKYVETSVIPTVQVNADDYTMALSSFIYYQDQDTGEWVEFQTVYGDKNRIWVDFDQIPDAMWQAAVAIEDHRFFEHNGVDWKRTAGAVVNMFIGMKDTFGGSTITQQMLKNMTEDDDPYVNRKVREIFRALEFEKNYTKEEILCLYLNTIYFGQGCYGVQTAAQFYFGKDVSELDAAECASLIAITNNPYQYSPMSSLVITREDGTQVTAKELNKSRQETILTRMAGGDEESGITGLSYLTMEEAEAAKAEVLQFTDTSEAPSTKVNSWFVDQVIRDVSADLSEQMGITVKEARAKLYNSGYHIYTTLDPEIQSIAESVYEDRGNLNNLTSSSGQLIRSGITIVEPSTGNIVAMVGDMGEKEGNLIWNYATEQRQVGSSIKPLTVYAPALDAGAITMATTFDNYPVRLMNGTAWPKNSPSGYTGWTTLSTGVARSINTVAIQALERLGVTNSFTFATEKLGLDLVPQDMDESPLGLGGLTLGLSTVEMAAAYATFANGGIYNSPRTYVRVTDSNDNTILENAGEQHVAMKETTAYFMNTLLQGVVSSGTGTAASFSGMSIAGKTGTTNDNYTRYFVGYTPYYVAAVWTGYKYNEKVSYSGNPAITLWKKVMEQVHADLPNKSFSTPSSGLTQVTVCRDSGLLPTDACRADPRQDRLMTVTVATGTAPTTQCDLHVIREVCTEGNCLAGEFCPEEAVETLGYLDYVRTDYGDSIVADDNAYLVSTLEGNLTEEGGCPVHTAAVEEEPEEQDPNDPDAPFIDDPVDDGSGSGDNSGGGDDTDLSDDPSGGYGDANWNSFWNLVQ